MRIGNPHKFLEEETRLRSLNNLLNSPVVGFQEDLFEDFVDECLQLLQKTSASVPDVDGNAAANLLASFNDESVSMAIITYFKVSHSSFSCPLLEISNIKTINGKLICFSAAGKCLDSYSSR